MRYRIMLEIVIRVIILFILWEYIAMLYRFVSSYSIYMLLHMDLDSLAKLILIVISSTSALVSLLFANITTFFIAIITRSIVEGLIGYGSAYRVLIYLSLILILDTIRSFYRDGQERSVRIEMKKMFSGVISLTIIILAIVFTSYLLAQYVNSLTSSIQVTYTRLSFAITSNPLYLLAISIAIAVIMYRIILSIFDVTITYLYPSRQIALKVLLNEYDLDIHIVPPLSSIKGLVVASIVAPILYAIIYNFILDTIISSISRLAMDQNILFAIRICIAIAIFISMGIIFNRFEKGLIYSPKTILILSVAILLLIYGVGVYNTYISYRDIVQSILHPNIDALLHYITSIYYNFYILFIELIDILPKLFGVAP